MLDPIIKTKADFYNKKLQAFSELKKKSFDILLSVSKKRKLLVVCLSLRTDQILKWIMKSVDSAFDFSSDQTIYVNIGIQEVPTRRFVQN